MRGVSSFCSTGRRAFTLIELLLVVSLLAVVAFVAATSYRGVAENANDRLVRVEMQEIAKAIQQFKQDTGYYPKTGPFALSDDSGVPYDKLPTYAGSSNAERGRWFYSPANFYQLLTATSPLDGTVHALAAWDPETGRGWRGPYLKGYGDGYLAIGDGINDGSEKGTASGDPLAGNLVADVHGVADPFEHRSASGGGSPLLGWSVSVGGTKREKWGRPYLFLNLSDDPSIVRMGLVSMGPDGWYGPNPEKNNESDDIVLYID